MIGMRTAKVERALENIMQVLCCSRRVFAPALFPEEG